MADKQQIDRLFSENIFSQQDTYKEYLAFMSRGNINALPFASQCEVYLQNKNATIVNTLGGWGRVGRRVKKGNKPISVMYNGREMSLYDIKQATETEGKIPASELIWSSDDAKAVGINDSSYLYSPTGSSMSVIVEKQASEALKKVYPEWTGDDDWPDEALNFMSFCFASINYAVDARLSGKTDDGFLGDCYDTFQMESLEYVSYAMDIISNAVNIAFKRISKDIENGMKGRGRTEVGGNGVKNSDRASENTAYDKKIYTAPETVSHVRSGMALYKVGDRVKIDGTEYSIHSISDKEVELLDISNNLPFFRTEEREEFNKLIAAGSAAPPDAGMHEAGNETMPDAEVLPNTDGTAVISASGAKSIYAANVAAIRTLKGLEASGRLPDKNEKAVLMNYQGWGGCQYAFDDRNDKWRKEYSGLKELLDEKEYAEARASVNTAFYTPKEVIESIYAALNNMGFNGGRILEIKTHYLIQRYAA